MEYFGVEAGLPSRAVYAMAQDMDGYIWLSTQVGIHRFDGRRFKTIPNAALHLLSGKPARLYVDEQNRLWYSGVSNGASISYHAAIDLRTQQWLTVAQCTGGQMRQEEVVAIGKPQPGIPGIVLLRNDGTLFCLDKQLAQIGKFDLLTESAQLQLLTGANRGEYWGLHNHNFYHIEDGQASTRHEIPMPPDELLDGLKLTEGRPQFYYRKNNQRVIRRWENGAFSQIVVPMLNGQKYDQILYRAADFAVMASQDSIALADAAWQRLVAFPAFKNMPDDKVRPPCGTFVDRQGNIWIYSEDGVYKLSPKANPFRTLLPGRSVYGMLLQGHRLWVGGDTRSAYLDLATALRDDRQYPSHLLNFCQTADHSIWVIGNQGYIYQFAPDGQLLHTMDIGYKHELSSVYADPATDQLWIGTNKGLYRGMRETDTLRLVPVTEGNGATRGMLVRAFHRNAAGLWAGGSKGLVCLDPATGRSLREISAQNGLPMADLNHFCEDAQGNFWLATRGGGLIHWDTQANTFRQYTQADGLSNNNIYAVYEDELGTLWLPSDYGLMAFDPQSGNVRVYHVADGIAHEEFNTYSHYRAPDGTLYFGGLNGITSFHPRDLRANASDVEPLLALNQIRVLRAGAEDYEDRTSLYRQSHEIVLQPDDQMMDLDFSYLDFDRVGSNRIAYRLLGYRDQWVYPDELSIHLMHLPYGSYTLQVKAYGASGVWTTKYLEVPVAVLRPFYLRAWFILLMVLLVALLVLGWVRLRLRALQRDRQRLEQEVQKRTATIAAQAGALMALDQAKSRFFANITHEFRTPLTLVIGPVEQILQADAPLEVRKPLRGVLRNARSLLGLINQLLDISKLEHDQMQLELMHGDIFAFTAEIVASFAPMAQQKEQHLHFKQAGQMREVNFDADKWIKVLSNLVSNAIKFTPAGGRIVVDLAIELGEKGPQLQLSVQDTGIGIPAAELGKVFDRFYQLESEHKPIQAGTGIGLALVKELVEFQGGTIHVDSEVGVGTRFDVHIPIPGGHAEKHALPSLERPDVAEESFAPENESQSGEAGRLDLLLVEDNAELRAYIRSCIDESKYCVHEAYDGEMGIQMALELVPDLIVSDVMMPGKDGFELTETIRHHIATSHIPLILLTARASLESRLEGLRRGADAYLTKPFSPEELRVRIDKLIALRQLLQARYRASHDATRVPTQAPEPEAQFQQEDQFMTDLRSFLDAHLDDPELNVASIATHFGVSRTQLYRKLASLTDAGVADLIRSARCERALVLIRQQELSLSEIAYEVGYSSPSHFSRSFKQQFGLAPSEVLRTAESPQARG